MDELTSKASSTILPITTRTGVWTSLNAKHNPINCLGTCLIQLQTLTPKTNQTPFLMHAIITMDELTSKASSTILPITTRTGVWTSLNAGAWWK
jgi:hypothetical protein